MPRASLLRRAKSGDTKAGDAKYGETDINTTSRLRNTTSGRITKPEKTAVPSRHKAAAKEMSKSRLNVRNEHAGNEDVGEEVGRADPFPYYGNGTVVIDGKVIHDERLARGLAEQRFIASLEQRWRQTRARGKQDNDTETVGAVAEAQAEMNEDNAAVQDSEDELLLESKNAGIAAGEDAPDEKHAHIAEAEGNKFLNNVQQLLSAYLERSHAGLPNGPPGRAAGRVRASGGSHASTIAVLDAARSNGILNSTHQTLSAAFALLSAASRSASPGEASTLASNGQAAMTRLNAEVTAPRTPEPPRECAVCLEPLGVTLEPEEVCRRCGFVIHTQCRTRQHDFDRANNRPLKCLNCQQAWAGSKKVILVE